MESGNQTMTMLPVTLEDHTGQCNYICIHTSAGDECACSCKSTFLSSVLYGLHPHRPLAGIALLPCVCSCISDGHLGANWPLLACIIQTLLGCVSSSLLCCAQRINWCSIDRLQQRIWSCGARSSLSKHSLYCGLNKLLTVVAH